VAIEFGRVTPVLRIYVAKADEFYQDFLGFGVDWDHRFDANAPLCRQISRGALVSISRNIMGPGVRVSGRADSRDDARCGGVSSGDQREELSLYAARLEPTAWGTLETGVIDPFGNLIRFYQTVERSEAAE
jgi:hypothetical protein